jgi:hypothetical protein
MTKAGLTLRKEWQMYAKCNKRQLLECLKKTVKCNTGKSNTFFFQKHLSGHREKLDIFETVLSIAATHRQAMKQTASVTAKLRCGFF